MVQKILIGAVALALLGASPLQAQERMTGVGMMGQGGQPSAEDAAAFVDARIAALKAGLRLSPDQDKNWPAYEQAYRDLAKMRTARRETGGDDQSPRDPVARMARQADLLSTHGAALKRLADAAAPLYQSLDDAQKRRFVLLSRPVGARHHRMFEHRQGGPGDRGR
jgi:zinc resistance-associated protein